MVSLFASLLLGLIRGATHALEPDHLAAVSTLVATEPRRRRVVALGFAWGLGHAITIVTASIVLLALRRQLPTWLAEGFELVVAFVLLYLGASALVRAFRKGPLGRHHRHAHGALVHEHVGSDDHLHLGQWTLARRSLVVGLVHGLAGSGALTALALSSTRDLWLGVVYTGLFGVGSVLGMGAVAALLGTALRRVIQTARAERVLLGTAGAISLGTGAFWSAAHLGLL